MDQYAYQVQGGFETRDVVGTLSLLRQVVQEVHGRETYRCCGRYVTNEMRGWEMLKEQGPGEGVPELQPQPRLVLLPAANLVEHKSMEVLLTQYLRVSLCWNDPERAIREEMSVERALCELREVREHAMRHKNGCALAMRADSLMWEIVYKNVDNPADIAAMEADA
jgi:hypothetical protein